MKIHRGQVLKSTGSWYQVLSEDGEMYSCRIRGKFRTEGIKSTNPVAVGDKVKFEVEEEGTGVISTIEKRKNHIVRKSVNLSKRSHILAANLDQALLLVTLKNPRTYPAFIDRFSVNASAYHIPLVLVFNKMDIYDEEEMKELNELIGIYERIGFPCYKVSAEKQEGIDTVKELLKDKVTLLAGHSGVGKSTLINKIEPGFNLSTKIISKAYQGGQHTTTFAEMYPLKMGGFIIDTPGIKGFGLVDFEKEEMANYFPEMKALLPNCKYYNCLHIKEPHCAVKEAIEKGGIATSRYKSYLDMYYDNESEIYR